MHSGPTNANRAAAGGVGALVAVVAMWVLSAYAGVNPPT
jgi:hypothetical protein